VRRPGIWGLNEKDFEMLSEHNKDKDMKAADESPESCGEIGVVLNNNTHLARLKLSPYHHMLCQPRLYGYSLKQKKWLGFYIDQVSEIEWDPHAFDSLVLPTGQKELVLAFSESHLQNREAFDDVISGKGRGMIMLLAGPLGVGKTLTAEAMAEHMRCPLHSITSGDLGSTPGEVERALSRILELVARWNAVLLIDECDVFLEARTTHDLERNKMVSIFLRTLEYYEGIMFMTTNRADNIDAAFQSRIHVSIDYPNLSTESRRHIWAGMLKSANVEHGLADADLDDLSQWSLNGRQIKNILRSSQLLALHKKTPLSMALIETVHNIENSRSR
jgi:SpoVK/Ycf46/Vps4 family AAA+-type ATPase